MVALLVMFNVVVSLTKHYLTWNTSIVGKTATAKRWASEKNISIQEAERHLDAQLFLDEIPRWEPGRPHHSLLYQKMFTHAKVVGLKEYHLGICWGHHQPSPDRSPQAEVSAMGLLNPQTTHEEILALYQEVYQLRRDPGEVQCSEDIAEETQAKILEVLRECLWHRMGPTHPEREAR